MMLLDFLEMLVEFTVNLLKRKLVGEYHISQQM